MKDGERVKIYWNATLAWAISYGDYGLCMALSTDSSYLIAGTSFSGDAYLGKLNSTNGAVLTSFSSS